MQNNNKKHGQTPVKRKRATKVIVKPIEKSTDNAATEVTPAAVVKPKTTREKTGGRKKGTPNKIRADVTNIIRDITDKNIGNAERWLTETGTNNPAKALELYIELLKLITPKPVAVVAESSTKDKSFWEEIFDRTKKAADSQPLMTKVI